MYRSTPKLVVLLAIAAVIGAIYYVTRDGGGLPSRQPGVIYFDPGIGGK